MLLSARMLYNVADVNTFEHVDNVEFVEGDTVNVYFQLVDANVDRANCGYLPAGRRYMPVSGSTLSVTLSNIDSAKQLTRAATQPFPTSDPSIWYVSILASDTIRGTCDLHLTLTQSSVITRGKLAAAVLISSQESF